MQNQDRLDMESIDSSVINSEVSDSSENEQIRSSAEISSDDGIKDIKGDDLYLTEEEKVQTKPAEFKPKAYVSAGHSNEDPGAVAGDATTEASITTEMRNLVAIELQARKVLFATDGAGDQNESLKVSIAKAQYCQGPAVEFHCNAAENPKAQGVEALSLDRPKQKAFAQDLCTAVAKVMDIPRRGADKGWKADSSGQHHRLGFCQEGRGVILEMFFISNVDELKKYREHKGRLAAAIAEVIAKHVTAYTKV